MKNTFLRLLVLLLFFTGFTVSGSNINTANLSYECTGTDQYKVTLEVFVECINGDNSLSSQNALSIFYESKKLGISDKILVLSKVPNLSDKWISLRCQTNFAATNCSSNGTERGIYKHVYEGTLNLSGFNETDDWFLYFQKNSRTSLNDFTITTLNQPFHCSVTLNSSVCNSSSKMNTIPIFKACIDKTEEFNLQLSDSDELRYRFETPKYTPTSNLAYNAGYSANRPISLTSDLVVNSEGKLVISATTLNEIGITTLVIEEWKNGKKIAETFKDIQIETFDCSNTPPTLSNFPNDTTNVQVCVGSKLDIGLTKNDAENGSSFFIQKADINNIFNTNSGKFSWKPTVANIGIHTFEIGVRDNACPYPEEVVKTFTIEVTALPVFDLGIGDTLNCNTGITYNPAITGNGPYTYEWRSKSSTNIISTDSNLVINSLGNLNSNTFDVIVTDKFGCINTDLVSLTHPIQADFLPIKRCFQDSSTFNNLTKSIKGNITSYEWNFDNPKSGISNSNKKSPVVLFPNIGDYTTTLTVKNDLGCTDVFSYDVKICAHPENVAYKRLDSCSLERIDGDGGVPFSDITDYEFNSCGRDSLYFGLFNMKSIDTLNPYDSFQYGPSSFGVKIKFDSAGFYKLEMRTVTEAKCVDTFATKFIIHPRPTIALRQSDINLNCDKPDTTLIVVLDSLEKGTGDLIYEWKKNGIDLDANKQFFIQDSSWADVNKTGVYTVNVIDSLACSYQRPLNIVYPLSADFRYSQVCELEDSMTFTEKGKSFFKLVEWKWDLGDGTPLKTFTNTSTYTHKYTNQDDYTVKLSLKDSTGCTANISHLVYNTFPIDTFSVNPVLATAFCENGKIIGQGNYPDSTLLAQGKSHIDLIYWSWNGVETNYSGASLGNGYNLEKTIPKNVDSLKVNYYILYNKHPEMGITTSCIRTPKAISQRIDEEIAGTFVINGNCTGDTLSVKFKSTSKSQITSWSWTFKERFSNTNAFAPSTDSIPAYEISKALAGKNYDIYLTTTDENGCYENFKGLPVKTTSISNVDPVSLTFEKTNLCLGESIKISSSEISDNNNPFLNTYFVYNLTTNETIFGGNFGNFQPAGKGNKFINDEYLPPFLKEGVNKVSIYVTYMNPPSIGSGGDTTYCGAYTDGEVTVYPAPKLAFEYESACAKDSITINNKSTIKIDEIIAWNWTLPDGSTTSDKNPSFTSNQGGINNISLEVTTRFGCSNNGENKINTTVYFYHTPIADFTIDSDVLEAFIDLPFESTSYVDGTNEEIKISTFDLGDGTFKTFTDETNASFLHSYPEIAIYNVTHKVVSNEGCEAEITKKVNLNTYLNIPTSFSPNKDGKNDDFGLIHKEIKDLQEYKIYNRWGELVFDGGNDPSARWDGTFRGQDQEVGVYILYVKASGAYNQEYNFKENITLIR